MGCITKDVEADPLYRMKNQQDQTKTNRELNQPKFDVLSAVEIGVSSIGLTYTKETAEKNDKNMYVFNRI